MKTTMVTIAMFTALFLAATFGFGGGEPASDRFDCASPILTVALVDFDRLTPTDGVLVSSPDALADRLSSFDIIALQNLRDASGETMAELLNSFRTAGFAFDAIVGPLHADVQQAFLFRTDVAAPLVRSRPESDFDSGFYSFVVRFALQGGTTDLTLVNLQTRGNAPYGRAQALEMLLDRVYKAYPDENDLVILGEVAAECLSGAPAEIDGVLTGLDFVLRMDYKSSIGPSAADCRRQRIYTSENTLDITWQESDGVDLAAPFGQSRALTAADSPLPAVYAVAVVSEPIEEDNDKDNDNRTQSGGYCFFSASSS
jgi:hypothetical protein